jgi:glutamyl/glutaminyl-tRNA synthetase
MSGLFRIAPTPSGFLHKGNIFNFMLTWLWAKKTGGNILLRIDDLDADRARPEYVDGIFRTLESLGLVWDIGPGSAADFEKNWSQKCRMEHYHKMLQTLRERHKLFACSCSRKELENFQIYPGTCVAKNISMDAENVAWRVLVDGSMSFNDMQKGTVTTNLEKEIGSFVVRRRDGIPAYQIASLADDLFFGVTHIVRGEDLVHSTAMQLFLAKTLGEVSFLETKFWHHGLLLSEAGDKISKSTGNVGDKLPSNSKIFSEFATWQGWRKPDSMTLQGLLELAGEYWDE